MSDSNPTPARRRQVDRWRNTLGRRSPTVPPPAHASRVILTALGLTFCVSCATTRTEERLGATRGPCEVSADSPGAEDQTATRRILTNDDVMDMVAKGVEEEAMIELITECEADFDVSAGELLALSRGGASEAVIRAMVAVTRGG